MTNDQLADLSYTVVAKSDQMNADDFIGGPVTYQIESIEAGSSPEQPINLNMSAAKVPYKPCLTMRRAMIGAWGKDGRAWVGQSMTLYCDPTIRFGPNKVGGIRISHMTGLPNNRPLKLLLTTTRSRRTEFTFNVLNITPPVIAQPIDRRADVEKFCNIMDMAGTIEQLQAGFKDGYTWAKSIGCDESASSLKQFYDTKKSDIE